MEDKEYLDKYEATVKEALCAFLQAKGEIDERLPEAADIEERWEAIGQAYLPDGVREFNQYPTVSLGWMMFVGMAVAKLWDEDWGKYSQTEDLYAMLRDVRGYDCMDEYICEDVLKLGVEGNSSRDAAEDSKNFAAEATSKLVADAAQIAHRSLMREGFEPGTPMAFHAYIRTLRELYLLGSAVQLKRMGYKMTKIS